MGDVIHVRDYQRNGARLAQLGAEMAQAFAECVKEMGGEVIDCWPPIKDTAPSEFCAPLDDPA